MVFYKCLKFSFKLGLAPVGLLVVILELISPHAPITSYFYHPAQQMPLDLLH